MVSNKQQNNKSSPALKLRDDTTYLNACSESVVMPLSVEVEKKKQTSHFARAK